MSRRPRLFLLLCVLAAVAGFLGGRIWLAVGQSGMGSSSAGTGLGGLDPGAWAPRLALPLLGGPGGSGPELGRRALVVDFFASWCAECRAELGSLARVASRAPKWIRFVGVDTADSNPQAALKDARSAGVSYLLLEDKSGAEAAAWRVEVLPTTYLVSEAGRVLSVLYGRHSSAQFEGWLAQYHWGRTGG